MPGKKTDNSLSLQGRTVLVTRPEQQGEGLLKKLQARGAKAIHYPVLELQPLVLGLPQRQATKQLLMNLDAYHHIIFISTNAVSFGVEWMEDYWPQWPVGIQWYAIGVATANAMMARGLNAAAPTVAMNSEALLAIMDLQQIDSQKVLIIRGVGGRDYLAEQLRNRGAVVDYAECYQRVLPTKPQGELDAMITSQNIDTVCVNSGESLDNLQRLAVSDTIKKMTLVVPGKRVAQLARAVGFENIIVADNASDDACVAALQQKEMR